MTSGWKRATSSSLRGSANAMPSPATSADAVHTGTGPASGSAPRPLAPAMPVHIAHTSPRPAARKITQPPSTSTNVQAICSGRGRNPQGAVLPRARSTISQRPCHAPHSTNVQAAPCQRPPSSIVSARLT